MEGDNLAPLAPKSQKPKPQSSFLGDVFRLATGTTIAQLVTVVVTPILSRLYAPSSFGVWGVYVSLSTVIIVIACLRYEVSIVLPEKDEDAANMLAVSLAFSALVSLIVLILVALGRNWVAELMRAPDLGPFLWLLPVNVFFGGAFNALNYWNTRTKQFMRLSIARVINSFVLIIIQIGGGLLVAKSSTGLIWGTAMSMLVSACLLGWQIWRDDSRIFHDTIRWDTMRRLIVRYKKFPLYGSWSALMNSLSWQLPSLLLTYFFSTQVSGYFTFGNRIIRMPMSLVGNSVSQVFFQRSTKAKSDGTLDKVVEGAFAQLVTFSLFPMLTLSLIGEEAVSVIFGANYSEAGVYLQILSLWTFFWFISSPLSNLFATLEKQDSAMYLNAVILFTRYVSLAIGGYLHDPRLAIVLFAVSGVITYGYLCAYIMIKTRVRNQTILKILFQNVLIFLPPGIVLYVLQSLRLNPWLLMGAAVLINAAYYLYQVKNQPQLAQLFKSVTKFSI